MEKSIYFTRISPNLILSCSKEIIDIFISGFAAYHPYVIAQKLPEDSAAIDIRLRNNSARIVKAGYNLRGKALEITLLQLSCRLIHLFSCFSRS